MTGPNRGSWRWKVEDPERNPRLDLLYEPGNWGDVFKGIWALVIARAAIVGPKGAPFRWLDPFAGAPVYPLVESARERLKALPVGTAAVEELAKAQALHGARGQLASTSTLVKDHALAAGVRPEILVFDSDPSRAAAWREVPEARPIACSCGEEAISRWRDSRPLDAILIDPYDLFDRFRQLLEAGLEASAELPVLFYLYNKSPRGGGHERSYRTLRRDLGGQTPKGVAVVLGRVPSDPLLPRAYHEMILAGPEKLVRTAEAELRAATLALSRHLHDQGTFESL